MPAAKGLLREVDRARDREALRDDGIGHAAVLGTHEVDDLKRRGDVDVGAARIAALGNPGIEHEGAGSEKRRRVCLASSVSPAPRVP